MHAISSAAFQTVCSQATSSLIVNQGNVAKVGKELLSSNTFKNLAVSMGTAGVLHGLASACPNTLAFLNSPSLFTDHILKGLTEEGVRMHVNYAINGGSYLKQLEEGALSGLVEGVANFAIQNVNGISKDGFANTVSRKVLFSAISAAQNAVLGDDPVAGAIGGAVGSTVTEAMDSFYADERAQMTRQYEAELKEAPHQRHVIQNKYGEHFAALNRRCADMGKYVAIAAAVALNQPADEVLARAAQVIETSFLTPKCEEAKAILAHGWEAVVAQTVPQETAPVMEPIDESKLAKILASQAQNKDDLADQIECLALSTEEKQAVYYIATARFDQSAQSMPDVPLDYYAPLQPETSPFTQVFALEKDKQERAQRERGELLSRQSAEEESRGRSHKRGAKGKCGRSLSPTRKEMHQRLKEATQTEADLEETWGKHKNPLVRFVYHFGQSIAQEEGMTLSAPYQKALDIRTVVKDGPEVLSEGASIVKDLYYGHPVNGDRLEALGDGLGNVTTCLITVGTRAKGGLKAGKSQPKMATPSKQRVSLVGLDLETSYRSQGRLTIRPGQEWKTKIVGRAQRTKTPGHDFESLKQAIRDAKDPEIGTVYLNRGYHRALKDHGIEARLASNGVVCGWGQKLGF